MQLCGLPDTRRDLALHSNNDESGFAEEADSSRFWFALCTFLDLSLADFEAMFVVDNIPLTIMRYRHTVMYFSGMFACYEMRVQDNDLQTRMERY